MHPDDGEPVTVNFGRFGPYARHNDEFRSLVSDEDVFTISLDAAVALLRAPKQQRRRQAAPKKVLRELSRDGTTLRLLLGRYGPYVTDGTTNASLPRGTSPETLSYEQAEELLRARRGMAPTPRRATGRRRMATAAVGARKTTRRKAVGA
jgi:DNA topoisomerase-1